MKRGIYENPIKNNSYFLLDIKKYGVIYITIGIINGSDSVLDIDHPGTYLHISYQIKSPMTLVIGNFK